MINNIDKNLQDPFNEMIDKKLKDNMVGYDEKIIELKKKIKNTFECCNENLDEVIKERIKMN